MFLESDKNKTTELVGFGDVLIVTVGIFGFDVFKYLKVSFNQSEDSSVLELLYFKQQ